MSLAVNKDSYHRHYPDPDDTVSNLTDLNNTSGDGFTVNALVRDAYPTVLVLI